MSTLRVYELAKTLNVSSKELIKMLADNGVEVKNHMSALDDETVEIIIQTYSPGLAVPVSGSPAEELAAPVKPAPPPPSAPPSAPKPSPKPTMAEQVVLACEEQGSGKKDKKKKKEKKGQVKKGKIIEFQQGMTVRQLAEQLNIPPSLCVADIIALGQMLSINHPVPFEVARDVGKKHGIDIIDAVEIIEEEEEEEAEQELTPKPPVVTVMGHVDHGKTTLLDTIRNTKVVDREAGGITQHIGASVVEVRGQKIIFLDTPGHEAFTTMRSRGAQVTDLVVLVVAADDGVMPQTIEAINHAKSANVPIVVAINKVDKPGANTEKVKQELAKYDLLTEEWGGKTTFCEISAKKGTGIDNLLEMILLNAEILELKSNPAIPARGVVLEARLDKGRGPVATVLVQKGTLRKGDPFVIGPTHGKVRAMLNDRGKPITDAPPATPVEVLGLCAIAQAGDPFQVVESEREAKTIAATRAESAKQRELSKSQRFTFDDLLDSIQEGTLKELNVIIKGDVQGACEAVDCSIGKLTNTKVKLHIIHCGVGSVSENDIMLASSSHAMIVGFNVKTEPSAAQLARREKVEIRLYSVIYELLDDLYRAMEGLLEPVKQEIRIGVAEVRQVFSISKVGVIAGCFVLEGKIQRNAIGHVIRNGDEIFSGQINSLKRFKDDAREVAAGFECGIGIAGFETFEEKDKIEVYVIEVKKDFLTK